MARSRRTRTFALAALLAWAGGATGTSDDDADAVERIEFRLSRNATGGAQVKDAIAGSQAWCDEFAKALSSAGRPMEIEADVARNMNSIVQGMDDGTVQAAYVSAVEYVRMRERIDIRAIATAINSDGIPHETGALIVRSELDARTVEDLAGHSFAHQGRLSSVGHLYPEALLAASGLPSIDEHFGTIVDVQTQRSALYSVILGKADATAVSSFAVDLVAELNPALGKRFRVIHESEPMPLGVLVISEQLDDEVVASFEAFIADQQEELAPRLRGVLQFMKVAGLRKPRAGEFDYVEELVRVVDQTSQRELDPICGRRIGADEIAHREAVGDAFVSFCGDACRARFARNRQPFGAEGREDVVVVGIVPQMRGDLDPRDLLAAIEQQFQGLGPALGLSISTELLPSVEIARARLTEGTVDLVRLSGPAYVRLREETELAPLVRPEASAETFQAVLLTSVDSGIENVTGLRGRTVALEDHDASEMSIFIEALVAGLGRERPEDFLGAIVRCPTEAGALRAVAFGNADAAAVSTSTLEVLTELQPALGKRLRQLEVSDALSHGPICVRAGLDDEVVARIREYMIGLHETPEGRAALTFFRLRRMVPAKDADYDGVRALLAKVADR